jgi:hypothetical protein
MALAMVGFSKVRFFFMTNKGVFKWEDNGEKLSNFRYVLVKSLKKKYT